MVSREKILADIRFYRPYIVLAFLAASVFLSYRAGRQDYWVPNGFPIDEARALFPGAESFLFEDGMYRLRSGEGVFLGSVLYGPPADKRIIGYAGEVPFLLGICPRGVVKGVHMLPSRETGDYAKRVAGRLAGAWTGLSPADAYREPVSAVTGATQTSAALIEGVREILLAATAPAGHGAEYTGSSGWPAAEVLAALFLVLAVYNHFSSFTPARVRLSFKVLSFVIPGLIAASVLSLAVFGSWAAGNISLQRHWLLILIGITAFCIPLIRGRNFYCYGFCPFGSAQDLAGKLVKKKMRTGKKIKNMTGAVRVAVLLFAFFAVAGGFGLNLYLIEPFASFRWTLAPWPSRVLAGVFLLLSIFLPRPWCRICPTGGLLDGLKRTWKKV